MALYIWLSYLFSDHTRYLEILGVVAVLIPKFPLLKEWAYAGFFFAMSGAAFSHIAVGDPVKEILPLVVALNPDCSVVVFQTCD
jgi:hypothetical protein